VFMIDIPDLPTWRGYVHKFANYMIGMAGSKMRILRTPYTLTFFTEGRRRIQLVLGNWGSKEDVLINSDIDCTCVGFDGEKVLATPRARMSFNYKMIVCNPALYRIRGVGSYEYRLTKYGLRGFVLIDPDFLKWKNNVEQTSKIEFTNSLPKMEGIWSIYQASQRFTKSKEVDWSFLNNGEFKFRPNANLSKITDDINAYVENFVYSVSGGYGRPRINKRRQNVGIISIAGLSRVISCWEPEAIESDFEMQPFTYYPGHYYEDRFGLTAKTLTDP